jgi:plasmid stabilization system protein ParE
VKRHVFDPLADQEYTEALRYYTSIEPEVGRRFYDEIESLILDIRTAPGRFRIVQGEVRRHFSQIFPYAVLYLDEPDRIVIVSVMHMRRDPGYWRSRLSV